MDIFILNVYRWEWYNQEFHYYLFAVKLDRCVGSCNTLNDLSNEVWAPKEVYI